MKALMAIFILLSLAACQGLIRFLPTITPTPAAPTHMRINITPRSPATARTFPNGSHIGPAAMASTPTPSPIRLTCLTAGYLNLRAAPDAAGRLLAILDPETELTVILTEYGPERARSGSWSWVQSPAGPGWIRSKFCIGKKELAR